MIVRTIGSVKHLIVGTTTYIFNIILKEKTTKEQVEELELRHNKQDHRVKDLEVLVTTLTANNCQLEGELVETKNYIDKVKKEPATVQQQSSAVVPDRVTSIATEGHSQPCHTSSLGIFTHSPQIIAVVGDKVLEISIFLPLYQTMNSSIDEG